VEPDVRQDRLREPVAAVEATASQDVLDPVVEAFDRAVRLRVDRKAWRCATPRSAGMKARSPGAARWGMAKSRSANFQPLSVRMRVIFIGAAFSGSRKKRRALAAIFAGEMRTKTDCVPEGGHGHAAVLTRRRAFWRSNWAELRCPGAG
jgi:hypothetical protein